MSKLETKVVYDIAGKFIVPAYQRGYRWGTDEVRRLLEDVFALKGQGGQPNKNYCLQPIVVKKLSDGTFELIDGQQRLTTLFLICNYMHRTSGGSIEEPIFSLSYKTRDKSADFLANIDIARKDENIDFHFMANAYEQIEKWFAGKVRQSVIRGHINELFAENVKIIWYEVDENADANKMFTRLNIGKIPLTSAELVKAMFLNGNNPGIDARRRDEIALQWDNIEKELHNDALWYFLTNNSAEKYQTRIDLLLNLMAGKTSEATDKYFTFVRFDERRRQGEDLIALWQEIVRTFLLLKDWRENHELYHKIGYLIASGYRTLPEIYAAARGKTKREFLAQLDAFIKESVKLTGNENYADWNYNDHAERIRRLLLLFNVESVRRNGEQSQWFPFDKFKFGGAGKNSWSLEHIHAVNSQDTGTQAQWRDWLKLHRASLANFPDENRDLLNAIDKMLALKDIKSNRFFELQKQILRKLSPEDMNDEAVDSIANLALLKCEVNSALGNSVFDVKRNAIIDLDMHGAFIPHCTKMAFLKYYTESEKNQIHFWSTTDRRAYLHAINDVLKDFLAEPIKER